MFARGLFNGSNGSNTGSWDTSDWTKHKGGVFHWSASSAHICKIVPLLQMLEWLSVFMVVDRLSMIRCVISYESTISEENRWWSWWFLETRKRHFFPFTTTTHTANVCECVCVGTKGSVVSFVCICACFCVVCVCSSAAAWPLCPTGGSQWGRGGDAVRARMEAVKVNVWPLTSVTCLNWVGGWSVWYWTGCRCSTTVQVFLLFHSKQMKSLLWSCWCGSGSTS